jgi:hypothetical protein
VGVVNAVDRAVRRRLVRTPQPSGWRSLTALVIAAFAAAFGVWLYGLRVDDLAEQRREDQRIIADQNKAIEQICAAVLDTGQAFYDYLAIILDEAPTERQEIFLPPLRDRLDMIPDCFDVVPVP